MTYEESKQVCDEVILACELIRNSKGKDYAGNNDVNANFKTVAERLGLTKYQTWSVYFLKQVDSIINAIKNNPEEPITSGEPWEQRIYDIINYALIFYRLKVEDGTITQQH